MMKKQGKKNIIKSFVDRLGQQMIFFPLLGIALFLIFYSIAAMLYPGGSWLSPTYEGFSIWNNYLCDLLDDISINGELNRAKYFARISLAVLCAGLMTLWYHLPKLFDHKGINLKIMLLSGYLSLFTILFLAAGTHDIIVRIAGFFGVIAFITCFIELFRVGHFSVLFYGILCLLVFLLNYYIYESGVFIVGLPIIQKITFLMFIVWFMYLNIIIYKKVKKVVNDFNHGPLL
ncbi:hypothetical protein ACOCEA_13915 [Maribacter sp. CXY002]|uniref:hypothetical protein n=1 Tax=Maribacter luteocoastalis TaxID=3407671 RepID=UPI003B66C5E1